MGLLISVVLLVVTLGLPAPAIAQARRHQAPTAPSPPIGLPQIGLSLPQIGLPQVPRIATPPPISWFGPSIPFRDGFSNTAPTRANSQHAGFRASRGRTPFVGMPVVVYVVPQYVIPVAMAAPAQPASPSRSRRRLPLSGSLVLQVEPGTAQVFVDGYYFGMPEDFDGQKGALALDSGPHKVELIAPEYETVTFDVRIAADQPVTYRTTMKPAPVAPLPPPAPAVPIKPQTMYLIPGCYVGNVPPSEAHLPATCAVSRALTFEP